MQSRQQAPEFIGHSQTFLSALEHASHVAKIDRPVLVIGERGAGKELFAERIHFLSLRWDGPLVKVNCAAMNEELLESELFGHEAGAFTGATKKHLGRFERAEGGTLFLDEIASASLRVQEKLLRVIEYGEYERIGGETTRLADIRVVAAANVDLRTLSQEGRFRADLLDRLAFDVIVAPPLRARRGDIPLLAAHFAKAMGIEIDAPFPGFSAEAMTTLQTHHWPGNIRELKNVVERAVYQWAAAPPSPLVDKITIDPFIHFTPPTQSHANQSRNTKKALDNDNTTHVTDLRAHLDATEKQIVEDALARHGDNQRLAAQALSLSYHQIRGIVRKHNIIGRTVARDAR